MKKIEPVRGYAVFTTLKDTKEIPPCELKKKMIEIISKQFLNYS